jgi:malate dehydrogenase
MTRKKVSIIGAGNVGATCAGWIATKGLADIVLIDVNEGLAKGKALDLDEANLMMSLDVVIEGGSDYALVGGSDVVVITAGVPRKKDPVTGLFPGRDELVKTNQAIVAEVTRQVARHAPDSVIIVVSNPLDAMCHVALHESGFPRQRVIGQAGALDAARFKTFISLELGVSVHNIHGIVLGGHGDQMVPLKRHTSVAGVPICELMSDEKLDEIIERTRKGGGEIVSLLGYSGYYAPAAGTVQMVAAILQDEKRVIPSSVFLTGEYGYDGLFLGVPAILGARGVERVIDMELNQEERAMLDRSADAVRSVVKTLAY